jgi:hypothetical protein
MKREGRGRLAGAAWLAAVAFVGALVVQGGVPTRADAQSNDTLEHLRDLAAFGRSVRDRLAGGAESPQLVDPAALPVSSGGLQLITLADRIDSLTAAVVQAAQIPAGQLRRPRSGGRVARPARVPNQPDAPPVVEVSDPSEAVDFVSRLAGMTQSETSVAWCGANAVVGFNDSGSFVASMLGLVDSPSGSFSVNGWSVSTSAGGEFSDKGTLLSDPLPSTVRSRDLFGDPVLGCTRESTFYYASLATDRPRTGGGVRLSGITVSRSSDGGQSFGGATMAVAKDASSHFLDKPWMAVAPGLTPDSDVIHVTYTDFDSSRATAACGLLPRTAIEYVRSVDGGATWVSPLVIDEVCGFLPFVQGSQVRTGLGNEVYVAWERYPNGRTPPRHIHIRRSINQGGSFASAAVVAGDVVGVGDGSALQGDFRAFLDLQGLAVDRSMGANRGRVYVSWHDGRNLSQMDPFGSPGCLPRAPGQPPAYCFGDILFSHSTNSAATAWSPPERVNNDPQGVAVDHFMPSLDVDSNGTAFVFFYDRRNDDRNFLIDAFLARSDDGGGSWLNQRMSPNSFAPITGWQDRVVNPAYMGDYIGMAADVSRISTGVLVAWGDNSRGDANVLAARSP